MESIKALRSAQGQPEYAFNDQHSRDGKVRIALRSALVKKVLLTHTRPGIAIIQPESYGFHGLMRALQGASW